MGLQQQIESDIKQAMLQKKKEELTALRAIKSAILLALTEKGSDNELSEDQELKMLTKLAKQRRDSAEIYSKENRSDLAEKEIFELGIIERYLPERLSEEEIRTEVSNIISQTGASTMKDMGKVMGMASKAMAGKADGKVISGIVKELLS